MDIILCCPVSHKRPTGAEAESSKSDPLALPMGALFLAQSLLKNGFTTTILHDDTENIISKLKEVITSTTIAIGISTFSGGMLAKAIQIAEYIRRNFSDKSIIWGGAHVTATPGQTLEHELVDYVVWGEGEQSLPLLAEAISTGTGFSKIKGIGYKEKGKLILTENMGFTPIGEVLDLPYHLLNMENYARKMLIGGDRWFGVLSSRGCPFLCKFCSNSSSTWPNTTLRYHSYEHIINTINTLVENYGADAIGFEDELTFLHEKRIVELCQALKSLKHNLTYRFSSRADVLSRFSDSTFKLLKDTGFVASGFGIESGFQRVLDFIGKKTTIKQIYEADEKLSQFDFFKSYSVMTCIPTETIAEMKMTLRLIVEILRKSIDSPYPIARLLAYIPLPGTELFEISQQHGFRSPTTIEGWTDFDYMNFRERRYKVRPWLTDDLVNYADEAIKKVAYTSVYFTGKGADKAKIDSVLENLLHFAK